jgi:Uncharacterized protein conserved in bacteria
MEKLLNRINELANKKKTIGLNEEELKEQKALREEYLQIFRAGFNEQLKTIKVVDSKGNDVTPEKLKQAKNKINKN